MSRAGKIRLAIIAGLVLLLELLTRTGTISSYAVIPPSEMAAALFRLIVTGEIFANLAKTLGAVAIAFSLAVAVGVSAGIFIHNRARLRRALDPFFATYYAVPFFIFYPLLVAIFGLSLLPVVMMGFAFAIVVVIISTLNALDRQPTILRKLGAVYRLDPLRTALLLRLPAAAPHFLTGVKLAFAYAFIGVIASEFLLSPAGLGYAIAFAYSSFDNETMYGLILFILLLATSINTLLHIYEQRLLRQHSRAFLGSSIGRGKAAGKVYSTVDILLVVLGTVVVWQLLNWAVGSNSVASPAATFALLIEALGDPLFLSHAWETLRAFGIALFYSAIIGIGIGGLLGLHKPSGEVGEPILISLYSTPKVTFLPIVLLIFGLGLASKVAFGVLHGVIPIMIFTMNAIRKIKPTYIKLGRVMNFSKPQEVISIVLPAALPEIVAGVRVGFSLTLLGVLIGEMFAGRKGLGYLVMHSISVADLAYTLMIAVFLFCAAGLVNFLLLSLDRRLTRHL